MIKLQIPRLFYFFLQKLVSVLENPFGFENLFNPGLRPSFSFQGLREVSVPARSYLPRVVDIWLFFKP